MSETTLTAPFSLESERGLLCSFFLAPREVGAFLAEKRITPGKLFHIGHQNILTAMQNLWANGTGIDMITATDELRRLGKLDESGGPSYVADVALYVPSAANVEHYVDAVEADYILREVIHACGDASKESSDREMPPMEIIGKLSTRVMALCSGASTEFFAIDELIQQVTADMDTAHRDKDKPKDVYSTGLVNLDDYLNGGIRPASSILISAPTKGGKSILADNILENFALTHNKPVILFSLEMPAKERAMRILSANSRVPLTAMIRGWLTTGHVSNLDAARKRISASKIIIRDNLFTQAQITSGIRQALQEHPDLGLVVIDYIQLIDAESSKNDTREMVLARISKAFRRMAMETRVPFLIVSQENEQGRSRESRALENDCTTWVQIQPTDVEGEKAFGVRLNRNGPNGQFLVTHLRECLRFENHANPES